MSRINKVFEKVKSSGKTAFISFIMAGDPNRELARDILARLPDAGVDIIEVGMPFTDPMADGITIQKAGLRALEAGQSLQKTLEDIEYFRKSNQDTPIILMGYYNPIYIYGVERFLSEAKKVGVDGLIIVDLPPEEDEELCLPSKTYGIDFIRLLTPTTTGKRFDKTLQNASGFLYYVSVNGITGDKSADEKDLTNRVAEIKTHSDLPIAVGFGVKSPEQVLQTAKSGADAVVVGSAIVNKIAEVKSKQDIDSLMTYIKSLTQVL